VVVAAATLAAPAERLTERLEALHRAVPMTGARLHRETWHPGPPPEPLIVDGDPLHAPELLDRFDLATQPPFRVVAGAGGLRVAVACHHAAFDGLSLVALLAGLVGVADRHGAEGAAAGQGVEDQGAVDSRGSRPAESATLPLRGPEPRGVGVAPALGPEQSGAGVGPARGRRRGRRPAPELRGLVGRMVRPADRVAPTLGWAGREALAVREVRLAGPGVTARVAEAAVAAAGARNARLGRAWRRVGINIGLAGPRGVAGDQPGPADPGDRPGPADPTDRPGPEDPSEQPGLGTPGRYPGLPADPGNRSRYRRVDLRAGEPVGPAVAAAVAGEREPLDQVWSPRVGWLLRPVVGRFSDSLLVSNLGRLEVPGVARLDFFPVARGRSAVAVGAVGVAGGPSTVSVRARDLSSEDAEGLLADLVARLEAEA
jgi:hypothetical protein